MMGGPKDLGVVITCHQGDLWLAKACFESVRYFMPGVPVCFLIDGDVATPVLDRLEGVSTLKRPAVRNNFLRERSFGFGLTKMVAFWEAPFERFLLLDADTLVWGEVSSLIETDRYDVVIDQGRTYTDAETAHWFFEARVVEKYFPEFSWRDRPYVCTGVIYSRRGSMDIEIYRRVLEIGAAEGNVWKYGEMGLLNFLLFYSADQGRFRLGTAPFQAIVPDIPRHELARRFSVGEHGPVVVGAPTVIHYAGPKPSTRDRDIWSPPELFFRKRYLRQACGIPLGLAHLMCRLDDEVRVRPVLKPLQRRLQFC